MTSENPIRLVEDEATGDRFLVYQSGDGLRLDIQFEGETLWMTQAQIAELFGRDQSVISRHIRKVFEEGELEEATSMHIVHKSQGRPVTTYNLDLVISVGYRVSSVQATQFRKWATGVLVQYARKGFVIDARRLKSPENADRIRELREIIRDIRADEANVHRELQQICAMCQDYAPGSEQAQRFYRNTQARLVYAVVSMTPAEVIAARADHNSDSMGLQSWPNDNIRKNDVTVSKNYLAEPELRELNRLTTILLDIFEDQLELGRLVVMQDAANLLETQLKQLGRSVLQGGEPVSKGDADLHAQQEYGLFKAEQKRLRHAKADETLRELAAEARKLGRPGRRKPGRK